MNLDTNFLSNNKHEMCLLLVDQFTSVFTIPDPQQIITDPVSFFTHELNTGMNKSLSLTDTELAPVLLLIFAPSLSHGVIPKSWKRAAIIPIYKSGNKTVPSNYSPISLTSVKC